jgi:hypothetical protein
MHVWRVRIFWWDVLAAVSVAGVLLLAHYVVPHWATLYGAYLVAFSIWMAWFVERTAGLLRRRRE